MREKPLDPFHAWRHFPTQWHHQDALFGYLPPVEAKGVTPPHFDDTYMLWFICQGKADLLVNETCYPVPPGSLLWTSPSLLHAHRAAGCMEVLFCLFSPAHVQEVWLSCASHRELPHAAIMAAPKPLETTLRRLLQEATHPTAASNHLLSVLSHLALIDVLQMFLAAQQQTHHPLCTREIALDSSHVSVSIAQAISLLRSEYAREEVTPKRVAEQVGLSLFHFTRRFKQETGVTPGSYLRQQRLNQALHLLLVTRLPLEAVAQRCGLGSARHLSDLCQTAFGQSPIQLRQSQAHQAIVTQLPAQRIVGNEQRNVL